MLNNILIFLIVTSTIGITNILYLTQSGSNIIQLDSPEPWAIGFQDGVSPGFTGIVELHDNIFFYLVVIAILVFWMLGSTIYYFNYDRTKITHKYLVHGTLIEILWTIFPAIVLLAIAIPSFRLLYILDEVTLPTITVKVTGHQWYWSYEYSDYETESGDPIEFDSYMIPDSDLEIGQTRLLEVDNPIVLPENTHVRFIVTSTDVLHDFALPAAGIKIDATPGRLNQSSFFSERTGELFGQCSELCGTYHGFMPIQVEVDSVDQYLNWISSLSAGLVLINKGIKDKMNKFLKLIPSFTFWLLDAVLFTVVLYLLFQDSVHIISSVWNRLIEWLILYDINVNELVSYMNSNGNNVTNSTSHTTTTIIHDDGSWGNSVKSIFLYSYAGFRLSLLKNGGTPLQRTFIVGTTLGAELTSRVLLNSINDPNYIQSHFRSWDLRWGRSGEVNVDISKDAVTSQKLAAVQNSTQTVVNSTTQSSSTSSTTDSLSKLIPDGPGMDDLAQKFVNTFLEFFKPVLEPVQVSYSNDILATQINHISLMLFLLTIFIMILIVALLLNILFLIYSDRLISYFNNKFIRGYLIFTQKFVALEVLVGGFIILYFMYALSLGIHFIATHPIIITQ